MTTMQDPLVHTVQATNFKNILFLWNYNIIAKKEYGCNKKVSFNHLQQNNEQSNKNAKILLCLSLTATFMFDSSPIFFICCIESYVKMEHTLSLAILDLAHILEFMGL